MNQVVLMGNLGADPELRQTEKSALLKMRLATSKTWVNDKGVKQEATEWHQITVWGKRAEGLAKILSKGDRILVVGEIKTRSYEGKDGEKRYSTEIHASDIELCGRAGDFRQARGDDRRPARNERPARRGRDEEPASDPFAGYR